MRLTLVDPTGNLAAYSVPQGTGNYGNVQITNPKPGTWTAFIWSNTSANGGTTGPVLFAAPRWRSTRRSAASARRA